MNDHQRTTERAKAYLYADGRRFLEKNAAEIFAEIAEQNLWREKESISGFGSSLEQTRELVETLPGIFRQLGIKILLDAPCGDFNWMKLVDLQGIEYTGGDIVPAIVERNQAAFGKAGVSFRHLDLMTDPLDGYDLLFCRDCLVHLSFNDIFQLLNNLKKSNIRYLMATTFPGERMNVDVPTGGWRPLNLQESPFLFPGPLFLLNEKCTEMDGLFSDKSLGVWEVERLPIFAI